MKPGSVETPKGESTRVPRLDGPAVPAANRHLWEITPIRDLMWLGGILFLLWFG